MTQEIQIDKDIVALDLTKNVHWSENREKML